MTIYAHPDIAARLWDARTFPAVEDSDALFQASERWRRASVRFRRHRDASLDTVEQDPDVLAKVVDWTLDAVEPATAADPDWTCGSLVLVGGTGEGKTYTAAAACRELAYHEAEAKLTTCDDLIEALTPSGDAGQFVEPGILLIDDLGAEKRTQHSAIKLLAVVNGRYEAHRPTIFTTNLEPDRLCAHLHKYDTADRTWSRIIDDAVFVKLAGGDRRKAANKVDTAGMVDIADRLKACARRTDAAVDSRARTAGIPAGSDPAFARGHATRVVDLWHEVLKERQSRYVSVARQLVAWNKANDPRERTALDAVARILGTSNVSRHYYSKTYFWEDIGEERLAAIEDAVEAVRNNTAP